MYQCFEKAQVEHYTNIKIRYDIMVYWDKFPNLHFTLKTMDTLVISSKHPTQRYNRMVDIVAVCNHDADIIFLQTKKILVTFNFFHKVHGSLDR